jgi:hypothetical protein
MDKVVLGEEAASPCLWGKGGWAVWGQSTDTCRLCKQWAKPDGVPISLILDCRPAAKGAAAAPTARLCQCRVVGRPLSPAAAQQICEGCFTWADRVTTQSCVS